MKIRILIRAAADNPRKEQHAGVENALHERERHHVAVGDVAQLVAEHGAQLLAGHLPHYVRRHRHKRAVPERARGECVGGAGVDRHFGSLHVRAAGEVFYTL